MRPPAKGEAATVFVAAYPDPAVMNFIQHIFEILKIELVLETATPCLEQDRKVAIGMDRRKQVPGPQPHQPERHAPLEAGFRQEQGALGVFAKPGSKDAALLQFSPEMNLNGLGSYEVEQVLVRCRPGKHEKERVVVRNHLKGRVLPLFPGMCQGKRERLIDPAAPEGMHDHLSYLTPADRIVDIFDQNMMTMGQGGPCCLLLPF